MDNNLDRDPSILLGILLDAPGVLTDDELDRALGWPSWRVADAAAHLGRAGLAHVHSRTAWASVAAREADRLLT